MTSVQTGMLPLENTEFWLIQLDGGVYSLIDRRLHCRDIPNEQPVLATKLATFTTGRYDKQCKYVFLCGSVTIDDKAHTVFFVVQKPDTSPQIKDLRWYIAEDLEPAIRHFESLSLSELATLFDL